MATIATQISATNCRFDITAPFIALELWPKIERSRSAAPRKAYAMLNKFRAFVIKRHLQ
jgi:hypothetical protein